jgi:cyclopropane fatty-acyl-phospholipid synthase-like methyltransferase
MQMDEQTLLARFPRSAGFDRDWMVANSMGPNAVWLTEYLCEVLKLKPGMKVLDLGCGKAMSSIFLAREYDVEVWASDLWIDAADNERRIEAAGLAGRVYAVHTEAHTLPFDEGFFDAVVSIDAYHYFGTDDLYLGYLTRFLKPGGLVGIVSPGLAEEFETEPPMHLQPAWHWEFASLHSPAWWRRHWQRIGKVDVLTADWLEEGWKHWVLWNRACAAQHDWVDADETAMLETDQGRNLGFVRLSAQVRESERWR